MTENPLSVGLSLNPTVRTKQVNRDNRRSNRGRFPVGESTVTYKYTIGHRLNKQDIECYVNIHVPGMLIKLIQFVTTGMILKNIQKACENF